MASTNFKIFAENVATDDIMTDSVYNADSQRKSGVAPGIALPSLHNKLYKQATIMPAAIAQCIVQAGYDANDSDYTGLVAGIKKTFAQTVNNVKADASGNINLTSVIETIRDKANFVVSVNNVKPDASRNVDISDVIRDIRDEKDYVFSVNNIKPDSEGNIDLTSVINEIKKAMYPRVGDIICTKNTTNPSVQYPGTTWSLLGADTFLMSTTTAGNVGKTGGANTHTITTAQMPSHNHSVSCGGSGSHSHTRGTMDITGTFGVHSHDTAGDNGQGGSRISGAFCTYSSWTGNKKTAGSDSSHGAVINFNASRNWSGNTSTVSNHTHTISIGNNGSGQAYDSRPQYISVYMWIRTA